MLNNAMSNTGALFPDSPRVTNIDTAIHTEPAIVVSS
jgi:hypothetical protein